MAAELPLAVGDKAPDFKSNVTGDSFVTLKEFAGKFNVVLFFYPKDDTPGCTIEAKSFSDHLQDFDELETQVFGVSVDSLDAHEDFQVNCEMDVGLISDPKGEMASLYGAMGDNGMCKRVSYIIDKKGKIVAVYPEVDPKTHVAEVIEVLRGL